MSVENGSPAKKAKLGNEEVDAQSEGDSIIQKSLEDIDACQNEIDSLNEKASEEILCVEQKYNRLRRPFYSKRNGHIKDIKNFWLTTFSNHPELHHVLTEQEEECLQHLSMVEVEEFEDIKSGYKLKFTFTENPFFSNSMICKEFHLGTQGVPTCTATSIDWKENMDLTKTKPNSYDDKSFFKWFLDTSEPATDEVAEVIKDDIWPNPLQYFLSNDSMENGFSEDENADDSVVIVEEEDDEDDDDVQVYNVDDEEDDDGGILYDSGDYETIDTVGEDDDDDDAVHVLDDEEDENDDDVHEISEEKEGDGPDGDAVQEDTISESKEVTQSTDT